EASSASTQQQDSIEIPALEEVQAVFSSPRTRALDLATEVFPSDRSPITNIFVTPELIEAGSGGGTDEETSPRRLDELRRRYPQSHLLWPLSLKPTRPA